MMAKRKIIKIDDDKCNGCGECIPNCPEGAIQVIDGKARLISDLFCDGLGACIGHCPEGAIKIEEREAEAYDEKRVMENIIKHGKNTIAAHLKHLKEHNETAYFKEALELLKTKGIQAPIEAAHSHGAHGFSGCPGSRVMEVKPSVGKDRKEYAVDGGSSELRTWPVQLMLVPVNAPFFKNANLLISADCVPFAYSDFHRKLLKDRILLVGCPKLDDLSVYEEKVADILKNNDIKSVAYAHMEVPCCSGLISVIEKAIKGSGKKILFKEITVTIKGEIE
jgi:NAD-dependent dihydropyrimidine dehydrogenase PreA subunit